MVEVNELLGRRTLIVGEAGSGKTKLLSEIVETLRNMGYGGEVTVIDLAPPKMGRVGGSLDEYIDVGGLNYLKPSLVYAPRRQACNPDDLLRYVNHNLQQARGLFRRYLEKPTRILAVNDLTIHLQGGEVDEVKEIINKAETFIATAYKGEALQEDYGTGVTKAEREKLGEVTKLMHRIIQL
ncbi:MAG TPA: hypothetical protein EYH45_01825 [Candidatus Caldiarchaeum subterraneum]|uniref:Helicase HerA central domain-containing protein n=1 Tax=Caldiarchaeum subterraneum TaxID=311458 RepID=A0A833EBI7_CALS0|nr:hypothetical protein [Aigarchaeota archaeon]HIQ29284.1 hypothetical protein [Candidatus Caldarchaeum subterraneum]